MKIVKSIIFIALTLVTAGCAGGCVDSVISLNDNFISDKAESKKKTEELFEYLNNKDLEGLKSMFCEIIRSTKDLDEQARLALDFFEGEIVSYDDRGTPNSGCSWENGKIVKLDIFTYITEIETSSDKQYEIRFSSYLVNVGRDDAIGFSELYITLTDTGEECKIGDYYLVNPERKW